MSELRVIIKPKVQVDKHSDDLLSPCFQVNSDVQLKDVPTTGEEYLLKVMKEREDYAKVSKCNIDISKFAKNQSCFIEELPRAEAPDIFKPTIEWQNIQVADFSEARLYVSRLEARNSRAIQKIEIEQDNLIGWKRFFRTRTPTISCILGIGHTLYDHALEVLTEVLDEVEPGQTIDYKTGQWIYAFLACTRQPLLSDTISILRNLARRCAEIRSHLNPEEENAREAAAPLNVFICLVSRYFRQHDLADK